MKGYLANGLFSISERVVNARIASKLREAIEGLDLYVPQENAGINDKESFADSLAITHADLGELAMSDFMVAVIDGNTIDEGVCGEIGFAYAKGIPIFGLWTDVRQHGRDNIRKIQALINDSAENQFMYRNLLIVGMIKDGGDISRSIEDLVYRVKTFTETGEY
jgi:nucleoside 2-deoxyribosyltransferase